MEERIRKLFKFYQERIENAKWLMSAQVTEDDKKPFKIKISCYEAFCKELFDTIAPKPYETLEYLDLAGQLDNLYRLPVKTVTTQETIQGIEDALTEMRKKHGFK